MKSTKGFQESETTLYDIMVDSGLSPLVKTHRTHNVKSKAQGNYGLWVINCNKYSTECERLIMGEARHVWGQGRVGNLCTFLTMLL